MANKMEKPADNAYVEKDEAVRTIWTLTRIITRRCMDDVNRSSDKDFKTITLDALSQEELQYIAEKSTFYPTS